MTERFDEWMERRLYGPDGFFASHGEAGGARGDFVTSPEVGPLFGAVLARALDAWWAELGRPDGFTVVEAGAGRGSLAAAILRAEPACLAVGEYVTVERSDRLRAAQSDLLGERVRRLADLDELDAQITGVLLANELLDNLPFRVAVRGEQRWDELCVVDDAPVLRGPIFPGSVPGGRAVEASGAVGTRLPICERSYAWVRSARARLRAGRVVAIDYGTRTSAELIGREWLRTYAGHQRGTDPFAAPGRTDITADVPFDQLPSGATITTQSEFLHAHGIDALVEEGRRIWGERAHLGDLEAMRARSRVTEAEALLDPSGLGGYLVAEWMVGSGSVEAPGVTPASA